jgi:hypothetical protein
MTEHCLFEKRVSEIRYEWNKGIERKFTSEVIRSLMGNIEVIVRYFADSPYILVCMGDITLFFEKWEYSKSVSGFNYQRYLDYFLGSEDDDFE